MRVSPLAIELAAARATTLPATDLANRLERRRLDVLRSSRPDAPPRHQDMRAAIGWTYNLLTDFQRRLLRRFSVAGGTFDIDDAEALGDGELAEVLDGLSALVDFHLVTPARADGPARFELAPSIRDFAAEELASAGDATESRRAGPAGSRPRPEGRRTDSLRRHPMPGGSGSRARMTACATPCSCAWTLGRAEKRSSLVAGLAPYWDARAAHQAHSLLDRAIELGAESDIQSAALAEALLWSGLMGIRVLVTERADLYVERLKRGEEWARQFGDDRLIMLAAECRLLTTLMTGDFERGAQATTERAGDRPAKRRAVLDQRFELHSARWDQAAADDRAITLGLAALDNARRAADTRASSTRP